MLHTGLVRSVLSAPPHPAMKVRENLGGRETHCRGGPGLDSPARAVAVPSCAWVKPPAPGGLSEGWGPRAASILCRWRPGAQGPVLHGSPQGLQNGALAVPYVIVTKLQQTIKVFLLVGHVEQGVGGGGPSEIHLAGWELCGAAPDTCPGVGGVRSRTQRPPELGRRKPCGWAQGGPLLTKGAPRFPPSPLCPYPEREMWTVRYYFET